LIDSEPNIKLINEENTTLRVNLNLVSSFIICIVKLFDNLNKLSRKYNIY